jgi:biopolymer transport protein ExbB
MGLVWQTTAATPLRWVAFACLIGAFPPPLSAQVTAEDSLPNMPVLTAPLAVQDMNIDAPSVTYNSPKIDAVTSPEIQQLPAEPQNLFEDILDDPQAAFTDASQEAGRFLKDGGPTIWAIAALSVIVVALVLWKIWRFFLAGAWSRRVSRRAVTVWESGDHGAALAMVDRRRGLRSRLTAAAMNARLTYTDTAAREETGRFAKRLLAQQGGGLRALELIATIAPLLGLLGTVLGMIAAFQALQEAGNRADPALLAGGIWEALLTTAAGMAVAIPASAALTWFEAVIDALRQDMEDMAARIFIAPLPVTETENPSLAAE